MKVCHFRLCRDWWICKALNGRLKIVSFATPHIWRRSHLCFRTKSLVWVESSRPDLWSCRAKPCQMPRSWLVDYLIVHLWRFIRCFGLAVIRNTAIFSSQTWRLYNQPGSSSISTSLWLSAKCLRVLREDCGLLPLTG